ncbi:MAG: metallophosphoesterase [Oscillospiraceae bacterium]|jgi:Icc-related predicted phosphoesterase|nr:metallophosphoesterase [Oscillospiraceae bacterium]
MKVLAVADEESRYIWDFFDRSAFEGVELILSCGDLERDYLEFLATMLPVPLLYVPGNHDKRFITDPPGGCLSIDGKLEVVKGLRICGLGGCLSKNPSAAYEYTESVMARRAQKLRRAIKRAGGVDILLTHSPAQGLGDGGDSFHRGFAVFRRLLDEFQPKVHLFGHMHTAYGNARTPQTYGATRLINACGYKMLSL